VVGRLSNGRSSSYLEARRGRGFSWGDVFFEADDGFFSPSSTGGNARAGVRDCLLGRKRKKETRLTIGSRAWGAARSPRGPPQTWARIQD